MLVQLIAAVMFFALHLDVRVYVHIRKYMVRCCASAPHPQWHGPQVAILLASVLLAVLLLPLARRSIELELLVSLLLLPALELELLLVILLLPLPKLLLGRTSSTRTINSTSTCTFTTASSSSSTTIIVITTRISRTSTTTPQPTPGVCFYLWAVQCSEESNIYLCLVHLGSREYWLLDRSTVV